MLNTSLLTSAAKVMTSTAPSQFTISAHFINSDSSSKFSWYPFRIDEIIIDRDFLANFSDEITMAMTISPHDYALLQDQGQSLLCVWTITYVNQYGKAVYTPAPIVKQYNVLIRDPRDWRKAVPDIQHYNEPSISITVQLVETDIYKLRHTKINTIFQNVTPTQAIHAITSAFGIEKIHMVPLDNTHQYDHIDIPSYQGIESVYGYLQSKFGLYPKGYASYITDGCLYIYPPFETAPIYDKTATFYQVDSGMYSGNYVYHQVEGKTISIVINSQPHSYDLSVAGSENKGTGFIFTRASRMTDGFAAVDSSTGAKFTEQPALSVVLQAARTVVKDLNNLFHVKATDNPFPTMSDVIQHQASLMNVQWMHADPFQIDPGHAVTYYYDQNKTMVKKTGIVEHAKFHIKPMRKMDSKDIFSTVGDLVLRLSPNATMTL